jgi:hypothetical protein
MIFGGILMPKELITALIAGAFVSKLTNNSTKLKNFSAGAFAGESLFVILKLALKALPF